ncbi:hypothetical protein KXX35_009424 [Aspergillus fumigatus]|nr:hypothetical protein KXX11_000305 [Aspergillus fumigatus]KAH1806575.1 hypothetical protein KXX35_009424 [Aspergillus fumigatus]
MSSFQPPIPVCDILAMDVGRKNRTAEEYCRAVGIDDPSRRYEGHTRWMSWDELDKFYWDAERGVATAWRASLMAKGKQPVRDVGDTADDAGVKHSEKMKWSWATTDGVPKRKPIMLERRLRDEELFVPMDMT